MEKQLIDLSIYKDYVEDWGIAEGIREIVQNAVDCGEFNIDFNDNILTITTIGQYLTIDKLALGKSSKRNDDTKIGKYGEGLKLAFLVLVRNGIDIEVQNGTDIWHPCLQQSKTFNCETLHIEILENTLINNGSCPQVIIKLMGLDNKDIEELCENNLVLRDEILGNDDLDLIETSYGQIIKNKDYAGKVFVEGLFIQEDSNVIFGFNFKSEYVKLDRDRKSINYYDLLELVASSIVDTGDMEIIYRCSRKGAFVDEVKDKLDDMDLISKKAYSDLYFQGEEPSILVDKKTDNYLRANDLQTISLTQENIIANYKTKYEEDERIISVINWANDFEDLYTQVSEKAFKRNKIKNEFPEQLKQFNQSKYKKMLSVINELKRRHFTKYRIEILEDCLKELSTYYFKELLECVDKNKVNDNDYKIEDLVK